MPAPRLPEQALLEAALAAARNMGFATEIVQIQPKLGRNTADALVRLTHRDNDALYAVELKRAMRPTTMGAAIHQIQRFGDQGLLITDYVTPPMADTLRAQRIPFIDAAGNAYLEHTGMLVWVKGQKPVEPIVPVTFGRAFQPTGLQVVFTLLCNPQWINLPYRELAQLAGVAHGTVGWVIPDLQKQGFVGELKGKRGGRRVFQAEKLLGQWADAYARQLRPRNLIGRYYARTIDDWRDWPLAEHAALWGEEPAGALLTDYLRPGTLTIYADKMPGLLAARYKLQKEATPGHTTVVELRRKFWHFKTENETRPIVPPVLVYADLLANGDGRCIETAKMVYDGYVARLLKSE